MLTRVDLKEVDSRIATRVLAAKIDLLKEMSKMEARIEKAAVARHSEIYTLVDGLAKEIKENDEFREVVTEQIRKIRVVVGV